MNIAGKLSSMTVQRYGSSASITYRWLIDPLLAPLRPRVAHLCRKYGLDSVLDIGSATGAQCETLNAMGIRTVGVDLSETMIASAKARAKGKIDYVVGSAFQLPFASGSFSAALLSLALHEHTEAERTLMIQEARRVVTSGGHLLFVEYSKPNRPRLHIPWRVIEGIENMAGGDHRAGFRQFMSSGGLHGLLERHRLTPTQVDYSHFRTLAIALVPVVPSP